MRAAATARPAAKSTEPATAAAPATAATPTSAGVAPPAAASATHAAKDGTDQEAGAHPSAAPAGTGAAAACKHEKDDDAKDEPDPDATEVMIFVLRGLPELRHSGQRHPFIIGNIFCQLPCGRSYAAVVVALPEIGNQQASGISRARVVDHWFEAVANLRPVLPIVRRYEQHHTVVLLFLANAELFIQIVRVGLDVIAIERFHRNDGHLRAGLLFEFRAQGFQLGFCLRLNDAREVGHVTGRTNLLDIFGARGPARK